MMNIARALRLSASCLALTTGSALAYPIPGDIPPLSLLKLNTHTQTQNLSADSILKNQPSLQISGAPRLLAAGIMLEQRALGHNPSAANRWLTASVCFITDTNDCSGNAFGGGEDYPNKPNPIDPIQPVPDEDKCSELGFKKTSCSEGYSPSGFCSYNSTYFKECVCSEACPDGYQDYPCGSGLLQADNVTPNCKACYKCVACEDKCPGGYSSQSGSCRQASSYVTECGNKCYKVLDNSCKSGQLSAPAESGGYKNKIVSYTDCGNPCFQSFNDNCDSGYVKTKESGKCYETTAKYTDYGTACYKEKKCCNGYYGYDEAMKQCPYGVKSSYVDGCSGYYTCKSCSEAGYTVSCPSGQNHISGGSGDVCEGKYKKCTCEKGYSWWTTECRKNCTLKSCAIGDVLFSNKKCYTCTSPNGSYYGMEPEAGVTAIGVVFAAGKAISLADLNRNTTLGWDSANEICKATSAVTGFGGGLPKKDEWLQIYNNIDLVQAGLRLAYLYDPSISDNVQYNFLGMLEVAPLASAYYCSSTYSRTSSYTSTEYHYFVNPVSSAVTDNSGCPNARCSFSF